ncbi:MULTISPECIES: anthranilate phosphoribosyltransferase [Bacillaceae]|uniref:Anthranilate phosphoribosyltransferase n=1 Tax=Evansella alkalicola TaxID=745819 RepID=A0ABS6JVG6_9BACI|nr:MULTISPECIES: glycosyl transferase [Bacillaceae]MBU9722573.1 anthranilate phosphoribosyltransferase [Bacillus alkalicola]
MKEWIKEVAKGKKRARDLNFDEGLAAANSIINGEATDVQIAAFLIAQRLKTESPEEVAAFVHAFRRATETIPLSEETRKNLVDFSGPYDGRKTFAATVPVSILLAESGIPVFLHSSDTLPPKNGSTIKDVLQGLDLPVDLTGEQIASSIETNHIGFSWTESLCPPLARVRHIRKEIGVRSFLNMVEKLLNQANANSIMLGIFHKTVLDTNVDNLRLLQFDKSYIVQGAEGSEDLPIHRKSFIYEVTPDQVHNRDLDPADYGLFCRRDPEKEAISLQEQVQIIHSLLEGDNSEKLTYYRNQVIFNAAARYTLFGKTSSIEAGIDLATEQLEAQKGAAHLNRWRDHLLKGFDETQSVSGL